MRATRYLNWRINRRISLEDKALIERVQSGMGTSGYTVGPLSDGEVCLRGFGKRMRSLIPEARLHRAPLRGWSLQRTARREAESDLITPLSCSPTR
jgi:hypothetical protein